MMKHLISLLLALILASVSWSQDSAESSDTEAEVSEVSEPAEVAEASEEEGSKRSQKNLHFLPFSLENICGMFRQDIRTFAPQMSECPA